MESPAPGAEASSIRPTGRLQPVARQCLSALASVCCERVLGSGRALCAMVSVRSGASGPRRGVLLAVHAWAVASASRSCSHGAASGPGGDQFKRPRGVTISTLDSESSDRGSNPREASSSSARRRRALIKRVGRAQPMDALGIEPRAFRMQSGCDTTTPCVQ